MWSPPLFFFSLDVFRSATSSFRRVPKTFSPLFPFLPVFHQRESVVVAVSVFFAEMQRRTPPLVGFRINSRRSRRRKTTRRVIGPLSLESPQSFTRDPFPSALKATETIQSHQSKMVLIKSAASDITPQNAQLRLNSNRSICYVAPRKVDLTAVVESDNFGPTKRSEYSTQSDMWEGVSELCQSIDDSMEIEKETELLVGKSVLEIGFCTGLPSVLAIDCGAHDVTLHCADKMSLDLYVKPTIRRNNVPRNLCKFSSGDLQSLQRSLGDKRFDVILAPELIHCDEEEFAGIHDLLDAALNANGIILFSGRAYYSNYSGSMSRFLEMVKLRGSFDAYIRWTSPRGDLAPRKVVQLTRSLR